MSFYLALATMLDIDDIDTIRQALELMTSLSSGVESTTPEKQLEVLAQTLAVDAKAPSRLDGRRFWHELLHLQCNKLESAEDPVFRLDALIKAGLEWQHRHCEAENLYEDSFPRILSPGEFYSKKKTAVLGRLLDKTFKDFPLALQARVRLQRSYVNLYKARDRTREVQHTLPYKVAAELSIGRFAYCFGELYDLCLSASEGQGHQKVVKAWKAWEVSRHPIHLLLLSLRLNAALLCSRGTFTQLENKLLEFLQYELPKSSWRFFDRVNMLSLGAGVAPKYINFTFLHQLCQMDFPFSGKYMEDLTDMSVRSRGVFGYLSETFCLTLSNSRMDSSPAEKILEALQLDTTPQPWEGWGPISRSALNSFDTSHWTKSLIKVVGENSPRNWRSKDLVQIFEFFKSGWSSEILTSRQLRLVEKWIAEAGCEKLKALSELYKNGDLPLEELPF